MVASGGFCRFGGHNVRRASNKRRERISQRVCVRVLQEHAGRCRMGFGLMLAPRVKREKEKWLEIGHGALRR